LIRTHEQIVRIVIWIRVQINEDGFFFTLAIEEQLDEFVEIAPLPSFGDLGALVFLLLLIRSRLDRLFVGFGPLGSAALALGERWQLPSFSQVWWELPREFVDQELAPGELQILLIHAVAAFESSQDGCWRSLQQSHIWVNVVSLREKAAIRSITQIG
jgi:hypothetical protein